MRVIEKILKIPLVFAALLVALIPACTFYNLNFKEDARLEIVTPENLSTVRLPFTIRWQIRDFTITLPTGVRSSDAGYFALFFDRGPMPPSEDLRWLATDDKPCLRTQGCPDEDYLNRLDVYTTSNTFFVVESLTDTRPFHRPKAKDRHQVTIVLLNGASERIGESAFSVKFVIGR